MKPAAALLFGSFLVIAGCAPALTSGGLPCNDDDECGRGQHCAFGTCHMGAPAQGDIDPEGSSDAGPSPSDAGPSSSDAGPSSSDAGPSSSDAGPSSSDAGEASEDSGSNVEEPDGGGTEEDAGSLQLPTSCLDLLEQYPGVPSGVYPIQPVEDGPIVDVYCEMDLEGGGWTRLVDFDAEADDACPGEWTRPDPVALPDAPAVCGRHNNSVSTATFATEVPYTEVLGTALGRQYRSTDSFYSAALDEVYMDGLSLTTTVAGSMTHVWSFATGLTKTLSDHTESGNICPCAEGSTDTTPGWLGDQDWYCDSASEVYPDQDVWLADEYLWDGAEGDGACSDGTDARWFKQTLPEETTDPVVARLMCNQARSNEDVGVVRLELYVR